MNSKHTPGPWVVGTYDHATFNITGPKGELPFIATIPKERPNRGANARLIAAAPDLLAALERIATFVRQTEYEEDAQYVADKSVEQARAAIAKAKGE